MNDIDAEVSLDDIDRSILNLIQTDFPLDERPYQVLGRRLDLPEADVLERVRRMRREGVIRRIGGNFTSSRLGYASTLCAAKVPDDKFAAFMACVNQYDGVTHNYRREHDFNVWFTFIAPSVREIEESLAEISAATGVKDIYNLPAENTFKIKVDFKFDDDTAK